MTLLLGLDVGTTSIKAVVYRTDGIAVAAASLPTPPHFPRSGQAFYRPHEFWDTHDLTDYLDELRPVRVRFSPNLSTGMTVRLDPADREALGRIAAEQGVGPSTLVRMWIKERLRDLAS